MANIVVFLQGPGRGKSSCRQAWWAHLAAHGWVLLDVPDVPAHGGEDVTTLQNAEGIRLAIHAVQLMSEDRGTDATLRIYFPRQLGDAAPPVPGVIDLPVPVWVEEQAAARDAQWFNALVAVGHAAGLVLE
jgi:hypothetical protein